MAYSDKVQISIYGPVAVVDELHKTLFSRVKADRTKRKDGWWVKLDDILYAFVEDRDVLSSYCLTTVTLPA
jgi:hypothetical protein